MTKTDFLREVKNMDTAEGIFALAVVNFSHKKDNKRGVWVDTGNPVTIWFNRSSNAIELNAYIWNHLSEDSLKSHTVFPFKNGAFTGWYGIALEPDSNTCCRKEKNGLTAISG